MARKKKETQETKPVKSKTEKVKKAIGPFDIIGYMFQRNNKFDELTPLMLEHNFFMINRTCAIMYPLHAQCFNKVNINGANVVKSWRLFLLKAHGYGRTPGFVYTKGAKQTSAKQSEASLLKDFSKDLQYQYCMHYNLSLKDFNDLLLFYPTYLLENLQQFKQIISAKNQIEKTV